MAYTPELSYKSSCTLRRISWALGVPMTQGIDLVFDYLPRILDRKMVCQGIKGKPEGMGINYREYKKYRSFGTGDLNRGLRIR